MFLPRPSWYRGAHSVVTNTAIATFGRLCGAGLGLLSVILLARALNKEQFGAYTVVLAYGAILTALADAGLYLTLTRAIATPGVDEEHHLSHTLLLRLLLFAVVFGLATIITELIPALGITPLLFLIAATGYFCQLISQLLLGLYQKHGLVWRATIGDLVGRFVQITVLWLIFARANVYLAVFAFAAGAAAALVVHRLLAPVRRLLPLVLEWRLLWRILHTTWPLGLMLVMNMIYFRLDTLLLALLRSDAEVGEYGLAYRLIESGLFFPAMVGGLLLPHLTLAVATSARSAAIAWLNEGIHLMSIAAGTALVILLGFTAPLIQLFGTAYLPSIPLLKILSLAFAIMFFGNLFGFTLVALGLNHTLLRLYAALAVVNLTLNLLFIPLAGAVAAAWTTVVTEGLATVIAGYIAYRHLPFSAYRPPLFIVAGAVVLTLFTNYWVASALPLLIRLVGAAAIYLSCLYIGGLFKPDHFKLLTTPTHATRA